jgi:hypothetical protein
MIESTHWQAANGFSGIRLETGPRNLKAEFISTFVKQGF